MSIWHSLEKYNLETNAIIATYNYPDTYALLSHPSEDTHTLALALINSDANHEGILLLDHKTLEHKALIKQKAFSAVTLPKSWFIAIHTDRKLATYDERTLRRVTHISTTDIKKIATDPLGRFIAFVAASPDEVLASIGTIYLCDIQTLQKLWSYTMSNIGCQCNTLEYTPDGEHLLVGTKTGDVHVFTVKHLD